MKKFTILAIVCMTLVSFGAMAQGMGGMGGGRGGMGGGMSGGGMGGQGMPQQQPQQQRGIEINAIGATGYFFIDVDEALKKIKIKSDAEKEAAVVAVIEKFHLSHQVVVEQHRADVDNLEFAKENLEAAEGDMQIMREIMTTVRASVSRIRPIMTKAHLELIEDITPLLNAKELKGWDRYYDALCDDNKFDPNAPQPQQRGERGEPGEGGERGERGERGEGGMPPHEELEEAEE